MPEGRKGRKKAKLSYEELEERNRLIDQLQQAGELNNMKRSLYAQLMLQESWQQEMKEKCRKAVQESGGGISKISFDELSTKLQSQGKSSIPKSVEANLKAQIRDACFGNK